MINFNMKCLLVWCFFQQFLVYAVADNFTFTYTMALRCKEHLCQHGYLYETFYRVDNEDRKKYKGAAFEMHLAILAGSNGHILLSTIPHPEPSDPVYEIVVGGGGNKFTELRRALRRNAKTSAKTHGILSPIEFRAFYIRISEDGVIEFGREGEPLPILSYTDVNPLTINYYSFAAWNGVEAKFLYDCPTPGDNSSSPDSQEVEPKLSKVDKLKYELLKDRLPNLPPAPIVNVQIGVKITSINYNAFDSKLSTGISIIVSWTDNSLAWNPSKFNDITRLSFRQGLIWRPTFLVINSHDIGAVEPKYPEMISVVNSGEATFHFHSVLNSWCFDTTMSMNKWPHDIYMCNIAIGAWDVHEQIRLQLLKQSDEKMKVFSAVDEVIRNEWDVKTYTTVIEVSVWNAIFPPQDNRTHQSDRVLIYVQLKRLASYYSLVFYTPLMVLVTFVLVSFWSEPLQMSRIWFYISTVVLIGMGLSFIDYFIPGPYVPSILVLYITVLGGVLLALLINIIMMMAVVDRLCKTTSVQAILTANWFRTVFCLPGIKTCRHYETINEGFANQDDDDSGFDVAPRNSREVEEMQTDAVEFDEREEMARALDRFMFGIYSVIFAVMLAMHY